MIKFNITTESRPKDNLILVPNFNIADFDKIRQDLAQIDWNAELAGLDTCEAWDIFKDRLSEIQFRHIPLRQKRSGIRNKPVWLTPEVTQAIRAKRKAFSTLKVSPLEVNHKAYQAARNEVKKTVRAAKRFKGAGFGETLR